MSGPQGRVTPETLETVEHTERAVKLRRDGYTYREIAKEMKITLREAHRLVTRAFRAVQRHAKEATEQYVELQVERLEAMYRALAPRMEKATEGQSRAIEVALKVLERQAKLLGLDAPAKTETKITYHHLSDAELLDEARKLKLDVHIHPPAPTLLLPGETELPPAVESEVRGLLTTTSVEPNPEAAGANEPGHADTLPT
jgi:hypothetical protein